MTRTEKIVRLSEFLDRHRSGILALPGVTNVGLGPRRLRDITSEMVIQVFIRTPGHAIMVRQAAANLLDARDVAVFVKGEIEPLAG